MLNRKRLASGYERIVRFLAFIGLPLSVLLYFTAGLRCSVIRYIIQ